MFVRLTLLSVLLLLAPSCGGSQAKEDAAPTPAPSSAEADEHAHEHGHAHEHEHGHGHGGHMHHDFPDPSTYVDRLESPERAAWQKPAEVVARLGLAGDETVVDVGAGSGYFTFRLAEAVPEGRVIATDIDDDMVKHLRERAEREGAGNVEVRQTGADETGVPADADVVLIVNVLHHIPGWPDWLRRVHDGVDGPARLVVVEFVPEPTPMGPPVETRIRPAALMEAGIAGGWHAADVEHELLPYQYIVTFTKE